MEELPKEVAEAEAVAPGLTKEEYAALALQNKKLGDEFLREDSTVGKEAQLEEAVHAYDEALSNAIEAFGEEGPEVAEYYHLYGSNLMRVTSMKMEEAYNTKLMETMAAQQQGEAKKLTQQELEQEAAGFSDEFEEAWEALERARMLYEQSGALLGAAAVRMSLGDACADVEEWADAVKEYGEAAKIFSSLVPDSRRNADALFWFGLALQATGAKDLCREAFMASRDAMSRLVALTADEAEKKNNQEILVELQQKVNQVMDDAFWETEEQKQKDIKVLENVGENDDDDNEEGNEEEKETEALKRFIDDAPIEQNEQDEPNKKQKMDNN